MKYFIDTEFHEYRKQPKVLGLDVDKKIDTIELISIGIVSEDIYVNKQSPINKDGNMLMVDLKENKSKEYYAICKDFDVKAAWDNEWLRKNVLMSILSELEYMDMSSKKFTWTKTRLNSLYNILHSRITNTALRSKYSRFKWLLNKYGKTRGQIAEEIKKFTLQGCLPNVTNEQAKANSDIFDADRPEFYAYYADYDWVVFCWLFGRMIDLPKGFPMYCIDLKQEFDNKASEEQLNLEKQGTYMTIEAIVVKFKKSNSYPKQFNAHNALDDAKWNKQLFKFIGNL